ncbi:unnamed protein product [Closterium sp. NIES-65]|nr:unnamed protein product [Closterium sp. NIES-65]
MMLPLCLTLLPSFHASDPPSPSPPLPHPLPFPIPSPSPSPPLPHPLPAPIPPSIASTSLLVLALVPSCCCSCPFCRKVCEMVSVLELDVREMVSVLDLDVREMVSVLDLDVLFYPCPVDGPTYRPKAIEMGGKRQFPYMVDPNTGVSMYESDEIIKYLANTYGNGSIPLMLQLGPITSTQKSTHYMLHCPSLSHALPHPFSDLLSHPLSKPIPPPPMLPVHYCRPSRHWPHDEALHAVPAAVPLRQAVGGSPVRARATPHPPHTQHLTSWRLPHSRVSPLLHSLPSMPSLQPSPFCKLVREALCERAIATPHPPHTQHLTSLHLPLTRVPSPLPALSLQPSPFCKLVREALCELELPQIYLNCTISLTSLHLPHTCVPSLSVFSATPAALSLLQAGSPKREALKKRIGRFQAPYLEDPNTGVKMFESAAIVKYLYDTYALSSP